MAAIRKLLVTSFALAALSAAGVWVGSTVAEVWRKGPGVVCQTIVAGLRECHLGNLLPGKPVTSFRIRRGRVVMVEVGIVID